MRIVKAESYIAHVDGRHINGGLIPGQRGGVKAGQWG
jgi:hypothetical protein